MLTGNPHMDAQRAFDRASRASRRHALAVRLRRRCVDRARLPVHSTLNRAPSPLASVKEIPVEAIHATVEPHRATQFDAAFRPAGKRTRARWERLWVAEQRGEVIPPISVVRTSSGYAVVDGHHRVSVARARGAVTIDAVVSAA
ncbi:ParB N-terminal domain-containing protein [Solirubrobacter sp. CPCC 204708]|uniref:ParB N-terminal domain-containing protein n=1 Tax=Solirubrobacter deserti TaxID=2282478 RepID=A0ABT4RS59_9ACTN|nr:ParB N-terminal domain-containing protein [Solirubrobacter deserti]MBE2314854.1 ParB N-terminal domain-containing protein [Solirubrobacter deserti]MDA0141081.1 ParB N-terminal domain-containing protein [Solirubrobacter deserti]